MSMTDPTPTEAAKLAAVSSLAERMEQALAGLPGGGEEYDRAVFDAMEAVRRVLAETPGPAGDNPWDTVERVGRYNLIDGWAAIKGGDGRWRLNHDDGRCFVHSCQSLYTALQIFHSREIKAILRSDRLTGDRIEVTDGARAGT